MFSVLLSFLLSLLSDESAFESDDGFVSLLTESTSPVASFTTSPLIPSIVENASSSIRPHDVGTFSFVKLVQPPKAPFLIALIVPGSDTLFRAVQFKKQYSEISSTPLTTLTFVSIFAP